MAFRKSIASRFLIAASMLLSLVVLTPASSPAVTDCAWECFKEGLRAEQECFDFWGEAAGQYMCSTTAEDARLACHQRTRCPLA